MIMVAGTAVQEGALTVVIRWFNCSGAVGSGLVSESLERPLWSWPIGVRVLELQAIS